MDKAKRRILDRDARSEWVRLRTLIMLRWMAVGGQGLAIFVAAFVLNFQIDLPSVLLVIGLSVLANLAVVVVYPENKRLSDPETMLFLLFDLTQLALLLFLTGGLNNPFALLILAPVTISATALRLTSTLFLGVVAIGLITLVAWVQVPLIDQDGTVMAAPRIYVVGHWVALVLGVVFLGGYARRVTVEIHSMGQAVLAAQMALLREQKLTDLGGVVAAAAHELGTPLATIKMTSTEMAEDLVDNPDLRQDAELIRDQADRCRDILRDMGRAGKDDTLLRVAPISDVVQQAAEPHENRGKSVHFTFRSKSGPDRQPFVDRQPEILHGLRNLVQNAVDFAQDNVWVDTSWSETTITVRVCDDGRGFPADLIGRIGDPFVRRRKSRQELEQRPEYEGMGLGLFIAKTLLERTGATLSFANGSDPFTFPYERPERSGAIIEVAWPRDALESDDASRSALGENPRFEA